MNENVKKDSQSQKEKYALKKSLAGFLVILLSIPSSYHYLQPNAKSKTKHINRQIINSGDSGRS